MSVNCIPGLACNNLQRSSVHGEGQARREQREQQSWEGHSRESNKPEQQGRYELRHIQRGLGDDGQPIAGERAIVRSRQSGCRRDSCDGVAN